MRASWSKVLTFLVLQWPPFFVLRDEIYQIRNYSSDNVRVLMRLEAGKLLKNRHAPIRILL
jgi:hypothetical protein